MEYKGKLYGKVGGQYFPLEQTTDDFESLTQKLEEKEKEIGQRNEYYENKIEMITRIVHERDQELGLLSTHLESKMTLLAACEKALSDRDAKLDSIQKEIELEIGDVKKSNSYSPS